MSKKIAILGSTGSIGKNTLRVIEALGADYEVTAISGHANVHLLARQAHQFHPRYIAVTDADGYSEIKNHLPQNDCKVLVGPEALVELATLDEVDIVVSAVVGAAGLAAAIAAVEKGKTLAIANKEPLVIAGKLLTEKTKQSGASIIPIDSEHSAIFQAMQAGKPDEVKKIILTASGGPFLDKTWQQINNATVEDALAHPTWNMGPKITIDSATMMNKALEVIEAVWLFGVSPDKIDVIIHPESVVHSMVEFVDDSIIAQMGTPDMCVPIQYALTYPKRLKGISAGLKLDEVGRLTFRKPDLEQFKALKLGFEVARLGGSAAAVFNAANEAAVKEFLEGTIRFGMIVELIEHCLSQHTQKADSDLDELLGADAWARNKVAEYLKVNHGIC